MPDPADLEHELRAAGARITRSRLAVLDAVQTHPHVDTETLIGATRVRLGEVSHRAVYDVLHASTDSGPVRRIQPEGSVARYEARGGDSFHHPVCRTGVAIAIADVDCADGIAPHLTPADEGASSSTSRGRLLGALPVLCGRPASPAPPDRPQRREGHRDDE